MIARVFFATFALLANFNAVFSQDAVIYVDVANKTEASEQLISLNPLEELSSELQSARADALLLYTDFASRAGNDLKTFLKNVTGLADHVMSSLNPGSVFDDPQECWTKFEFRIKKIEHDARRAAVYSGDSHHKFLLGHMIVFRMHLNKSEDYIKKCDKVTRNCGLSCETTPRVKRWRRLAMEEIHRVRDDIQHSRRSYRDLVSHARRKLNHLRKQAFIRSREAVEQFKYCSGSVF